MKPKIRSVISLLLAIILLNGCGDSAEVNATATPTVRPSPVVGTGTGDIKIGLIGPLTGPNAAYGAAMRRGVLLAIDDIKTSKLLGNRKIALIERDDRSDPEAARINFLDLVEKERVVALIGTVNDDVAMLQAPLVNQWQIPWIIPIATAHQLTSNSSPSPNYIFRVAVPDNEQADFMASFVLTKNFARPALISDNSKASQEGRKTLTAALKKAYIAPVFDEILYPDDKPEEQKTFVTNLKQAYPDLLLLWGPTQTAGQLLTLLNEQKANFPFLSNENLAVLGFGKQLPETADNVYMPQTFVIDNPNDRQQDFINHYRRYFNTDLLDFPSGLAQSYDAMRMLGEALIQPGAADNREILRGSLENLGSYEGLIKVYKQPWKPGSSREALSGQDLVMTYWKSNKLVKTS